MHSGHPRDPRVLVGNETHDDAGVFRLDAERALVQTIDFFTPVVDDPETFGRIAAVNSLSDIWAMGGVPLTALNLLAVPQGVFRDEDLGAMLTGGETVMVQAGVSLLGGHSIDDSEPKMGYAVTGLVHPDHIWRNATARPGGLLYLTKPIGTGLIVKAVQAGTATEAATMAATGAMLTPNREAAEAIREAVGDPEAATDVTGFGLLGHLWEMCEASGVHAIVRAARVPLLEGSLALAEADAFPRGSRRNLDYVRAHLTAEGVPSSLLGLLADAVTSGGLLFTVLPEESHSLEDAFRRRSLPLWQIGEMTAGPPHITILP